jgi:hypothetical protein
MASTQLQSLIDSQDNRELVRDQVAAILKIESDAQVVLAGQAAKDQRLWRLRVFSERSAPWNAFSSEEECDHRIPIVNVWVESTGFEKPRSNPISSQTATSTVHIDCYGFGVATETMQGHDSADLVAIREAERACRLCRRILMSGFYSYLGFPQQKSLPEGQEQVCFGRWVANITSFQPTANDVPVERVAAIRIDLEVTHAEHGPEYVGQPLESLALTLERAPDGEWLSAEYALT